ncbi:uncharacterized protein LOC128570147 isoform X1 [Nycticebus coucang]|uniref:uncharacterized protein LOC128570147 isoform X1 n=1 Tax=Nycticebus coucang TaxID=9470 RepID=UPI00234DB614|nr:uncharacterized protein LOC128570147 isoform X1 [Nycticebus coucang]
MSPEPLRCPPAPGARRIPAAGPARCSYDGGQESSALVAGPRRSYLAPLLSSPQWSGPSSALRHERGREGSQQRGEPEAAAGRRRQGREGRQGRGGSEGPRLQVQAPPSPQPPGGAEEHPRGHLGAFGSHGCGTSLRPHGNRKQDRLHLFISLFPGSFNPLFLSIGERPCRSL